MRGRAPKVYAEVWGTLYELAPGKRFTIPKLLKKLGPFDLSTVHRAVARAEAARLVAIEEVGQPNTWIRLSYPSPVTIEWLLERGASPTASHTFLETLRNEGYLARTAAGYVPAR